MELIKQYGDKNITIIKAGNEVYFKGKECALILGYINTNQAIRINVDEEDRQTLENLPATKKLAFKTDKKAVFINESGLYSLILKSKLEGAKKFKRWVTSEVLPSIRKTGEYKMPKDEEDTKKMIKISTGMEILEKLGMLSDRDKNFLGTQVKNLLMNETGVAVKDKYDYPISRRLTDHNIKYTTKTKGRVMMAGKVLKQLYVKKYNKNPEKRDSYIDGANRPVNSYSDEDFDIMDEALSQYFDF